MSAGNPSENGDFSGVAKNSYLIEDGQIRMPVSETMIAGNIAQTLIDISAISKEFVDFGTALMPWVKTSGVTISG
jgi:PmbA protein